MSKSHYTNQGIKQSKRLSVNLVSREMLPKADYVGSVSGAMVDKSEVFAYHTGEYGTPVIDASPLTMECEVVDIYETEGFDNFICAIVNTYAASDVLDSDSKLDYTKLYAPTDGYVQAVNFSPAEMVDAGTALFTLLDVSHMEIVTDIPVSEYRQRDHFARFYGKVAGIEEEFPMQLSSITPKADGNQLYQLRLTFAGQPDKRLTAGMNAEISIVVADKGGITGFAVPLCAVFQDTDGNTPCVWVFERDSTCLLYTSPSPRDCS